MKSSNMDNSENEKPLCDNTYALEKFPGKGGWTYVRIPEISPDKHSHFGWVRVRGTIERFEIRNCNLMPMGEGKLFLPVRAEIRKIIKKQAGDSVHIRLFPDRLPTTIPEELKLCLEDEPGAFEIFLTYTNAEQKACIEWIYSAKNDHTKVERIVKTIDKIVRSQKLRSK